MRLATGRPWECTVKLWPCATCRSKAEKERLASEALTKAGLAAKADKVDDFTTLDPRWALRIRLPRHPGCAAAYLGALWALGLLEQLTPVADPDHDSVGKTLEAARAPRVARPTGLLDDDF